jgi:hypothetical protein
MKDIHKQRLILMTIATLGAIAVFLPWVKTGGNVTLGIKNGNAAYLVILCFVGTIIICTYGNKSTILSSPWQYVAAGLCLLSAVIGIIKVLHVIGIGLILVQLLGVLGTVIALNLSKKKDDGIAELPNKVN